LRNANERIRLEMNRIAQIQRALLPGSLPVIPGTDIAVSYETFDEAGGDLYDLYPLSQAHGGSPDDQRWAVLIGDVSGHGPSAAVMMAMLHTILRTYPGVPDEPAQLLHYANHHLYQRQIEHSFVTAFLGIYDPTTHELVYARAGHNPPLVKGPGTHSDLRVLDENGGVPLGVLDEADYGHAVTRLEPSETLVLYTDGITEARGPGNRMFGVEGIESSLVDCSGEPSCVIEKVNFDLKLFQWGVRPQDDQTLLALQVTGD
jgi:serine phosphatase RsbU (regulator of sigma subunit)